MQFHVKNHSERTHCLDRDIEAGKTAVYSEEEFARVYKAIANAMGTQKYVHLTNDKGNSFAKAIPANRSELEVAVEDGGKRSALTADEVRAFGAELAPAAPVKDAVALTHENAVLAGQVEELKALLQKALPQRTETPKAASK